MFEQGHYAGRTVPTDTRQGTYATAPSGVMLASINTNDPAAMAGMLRLALNKWNSMPPTERMLTFDPASKKGEIRRPENSYPEDGLVIRVFSRDLPRDKKVEDWRAGAWNQDYAWFTKDELRSMLPAKIAPGEKARVPGALSYRLARLNFVDNVRGQTLAYDDQHIKTALLETEVLRRSGGIVTVRIRGATKAERDGEWAIAGFRDMNAPSRQKLGMSLKLYGTAQYDTVKNRFTSFEVVALGTRYGATQYNGRQDDLEPSPIGFFLTQAGTSAVEHVAPSFFWAYGWR